MNALTASMAKAVAADGVTVNAISPGTIKSDKLESGFRTVAATRGIAAEDAPWEDIQGGVLPLFAAVPLGRVGELSELAGCGRLPREPARWIYHRRQSSRGWRLFVNSLNWPRGSATDDPLQTGPTGLLLGNRRFDHKAQADQTMNHRRGFSIPSRPILGMLESVTRTVCRARCGPACRRPEGPSCRHSGASSRSSTPAFHSSEVIGFRATALRANAVIYDCFWPFRCDRNQN